MANVNNKRSQRGFLFYIGTAVFAVGFLWILVFWIRSNYPYAIAGAVIALVGIALLIIELRNRLRRHEDKLNQTLRKR